MSSDEDEERVKLYNPLERNRKRQHFVSFSSSESESDEESFYEESPLVRKRRRSLRQSTSPRNAAQRTGNDISLDDDGDDEGGVEMLMTEREREALRQSELQIELEIAQRIAQDAVLNQTRAIMSKISTTQRQISQQESDANFREIISLDSDDDDFSIVTSSKTNNDADLQILSSSHATTSAQANGGAATSHAHHQADKGERIMLKIRSNGERTDDVPIRMKEPFEVLYKSFCDLLGLPRSAVQMSLDGEALSLSATPLGNDLEAGDLIDAKVDFSKQSTANMKTFVRLRLIGEGKRPEIFKIDASSTIEKLHASFCKKHNIAYADDVVLRALGVKLRLSETIESYGLRDDDEIAVEIENFVDPSAISVQLRFSDGTTESHHVIPSAKVETLLVNIAQLRNIDMLNVSLRLDGEVMTSSRSFQYYDLEGGELIEVKLAS
ncbi:Ubiquitin domain [Globisporangium polare]